MGGVEKQLPHSPDPSWTLVWSLGMCSAGWMDSQCQQPAPGFFTEDADWRFRLGPETFIKTCLVWAPARGAQAASDEKQGCPQCVLLFMCETCV